MWQPTPMEYQVYVYIVSNLYRSFSFSILVAAPRPKKKEIYSLALSFKIFAYLLCASFRYNTGLSGYGFATL